MEVDNYEPQESAIRPIPLPETGGNRDSRGKARRGGLSRWRLPLGLFLAGALLAVGLFTLALVQPAPQAHADHAAVWTDDPNLINVSTVAQLNQIRWDQDGDGAPHNCPGGCQGYELTKDLYLATDITNWQPIDNYSAVFDGNGHVIANLHILRESERHVGLFRHLASDAQVKNLGIVDADVKGYTGSESDQATGVIAERNHGTITNVFVVGKVSGNNGVGGIAGRSDGKISTAWADIAVTGGSNAGGLVGAKSGGEIVNTHSRGSVTGETNVGGLVGALTGDGHVKHSYTIAETSAGFVLRGNSGGKVTASHDLVSTAQAALKGTPIGKGIYSGWDPVWQHGSALNYPALKVDFNGDGRATSNEFHQVNPGSPRGNTPYFKDRTVEDPNLDRYSFTSRVNNPLLWRYFEAITPLELPKATGGIGDVTYTISPSLIEGVTFDPQTHRITGTPDLWWPNTPLDTIQANSHVRQYTLTATDEQGGFDAINFCVAYYNWDDHFADRLKAHGADYLKVPDQLAECNSGHDGVIRGVPESAAPRFVFGDTPPLMVDWLSSEQQVSWTLPEARGGDGALTYDLKVSPTPDRKSFGAVSDRISGMSFNPDTRTLEGQDGSRSTLTRLVVHHFTYTVTDGAGRQDKMLFCVDQFSGSVVYWRNSGPSNLPGCSQSGDIPLGDRFATGTEDTFDSNAGRATNAKIVIDVNGNPVAELRFTQEVGALEFAHQKDVGTLRLPAAVGGSGVRTYELNPTTLPAGLSFDPASRAITGTPTAKQAVTEYTYTVGDTGGQFAQLTFTISVVDDAQPTFGAAAVDGQTWALNTDVGGIQLPAATGGNGGLTYSIEPSLPPGVSFDAGARTLNGAPTIAFPETTYTYTARDRDGDATALTFTIAVPDLVVEISITVSMSARDRVSMREGEAFTYQMWLDAQPAADVVVEVASDNGDGWTNNENWMSDKPIRHWHGVSVNDQGQVTHLSLRENNLNGALPAQLGKLRALQVISLDGNSIGGGLPSELGNLSNLTRLALNRNSLTGSIPSELGSLSNLSIIGLARNQLSGSLPTSLGNLTGLTKLSLHDNTELSGALPSGFTNLADLQRLAIANIGLCAPDDEAFSDWPDTVPDQPGGVPTCE